ncbi:hypothetical protein HaLaN_21135 [Haematococcus lacustris]|uniref:Uncharacterized protein n=1 Tax=Haematococcus lacustris TaxID=44745 RepID=A0A699ZLH5_HAELA|nr:hypothetical protein HaLaN_21135 [Haematococcus lacustris]
MPRGAKAIGLLLERSVACDAGASDAICIATATGEGATHGYGSLGCGKCTHDHSLIFFTRPPLVHGVRVQFACSVRARLLRPLAVLSPAASRIATSRRAHKLTPGLARRTLYLVKGGWETPTEMIAKRTKAHSWISSAAQLPALCRPYSVHPL